MGNSHRPLIHRFVKLLPAPPCYSTLQSSTNADTIGQSLIVCRSWMWVRLTGQQSNVNNGGKYSHLLPVCVRGRAKQICILASHGSPLHSHLLYMWRAVSGNYHGISTPWFVVVHTARLHPIIIPANEVTLSAQCRFSSSTVFRVLWLVPHATMRSFSVWCNHLCWTFVAWVG